MKGCFDGLQMPLAGNTNAHCFVAWIAVWNI